MWLWTRKQVWGWVTSTHICVAFDCASFCSVLRSSSHLTSMALSWGDPIIVYSYFPEKEVPVLRGEECVFTSSEGEIGFKSRPA